MKKNEVIFYFPTKSKSSPSHNRLNSFFNVLEERGFNLHQRIAPRSIIDIKREYSFCHKQSTKAIIVYSGPPFIANITLLLLNRRYINILDIRDGWSIAIKTGYGNTIKPNRLKALIIQMLEIIAIKNSKLCVAATPGLSTYLNRISGHNVPVVFNGYINNNRSLNKENNLYNKRKKKDIKFVCCGKFSEYGKDKVIAILNKMSNNFAVYFKISLSLIGSDKDRNAWIKDYVNNNKLPIEIFFLSPIEVTEVPVALLEYDCGISVIRDPSYDFGTKVFDYIAAGIPVLNYFVEANNFTRFFGGYLVEDAERLLTYRPPDCSDFSRDTQAKIFGDLVENE